MGAYRHRPWYILILGAVILTVWHHQAPGEDLPPAPEVPPDRDRSIPRSCTEPKCRPKGRRANQSKSLRRGSSQKSPVGWLVMDDATIRILTMAEEMAGDEQRAAIWFKHQPIPGWAGKTAYDLVQEGKADKVLAYLEAVKSGVYA